MKALIQAFKHVFLLFSLIAHIPALNASDVHLQAVISQNLVIIPVSVNGSVPLPFILDTGVRSTMILEPALKQPLKLDIHGRAYVLGLGSEGIVEAERSEYNHIQIGSLSLTDSASLLVLPENTLHLSSLLGFPVYGIIGYELFSRHPVSVSYSPPRVSIRSKSPHSRGRRRHVLPVELDHGKPYVYASTTREHDSLRLLIDLGASQAFYLNESLLPLAGSSIKSYLGTGLSGDLHGRLARLEQISLGELVFENPLVAFPDEGFLRFLGDNIQWDGLIGGGLLRRFEVTIDYPARQLLLRQYAGAFRPFRSNLSGLELISAGYRQEHTLIYYVRPGSPAGQAGLKQGDTLLSVNGRRSGQGRLPALRQELSGREGKRIRVVLMRDQSTQRKQFRLREDI